MSKKKKDVGKTQQSLEYARAHGYTVDLIDVVKAMRPSLLPSYREFIAKWVGVRCIAPNCDYGRVFGEVCRACKGTGLIPVNPKGHKIDKN